MQERVYIVAPEAPGWRVTLDDQSLGLFVTKRHALAAATEAARASRAAGCYAWVKVRQHETAPAE